MKFSILIYLLFLTNAQALNVKGLDVQGHRGARSVLPENSLAAFGHALNVGATPLELDLGVSKRRDISYFT